MVGGRRRATAVYSQLLNTRTENVLELQHFEDLPLGGEWTTRRRTVTEADVAAFVGLAGDYNPLYTDLEHARASQFGGPVAPGALVAALATGLGSMDVPLPATVGLVGMSWKFLLPVQPGDTLGSRWRLSRKRNVENPRWGLVVWQVDVENQRGEIVASAEVTRLVAKREQEQPAERSGRSRRRRRKGAPAGQAAADIVITEPVPEPAPADVPPPAARRRRRRGPAEPTPEPAGQPAEAPAMAFSGGPSAAPEASPFGQLTEPAQAAQAAQPPPGQPPTGGTPDSPPSRRRRRRRPSNGQEDGRQGGESQAESRPSEVAVTVPGSPPQSPSEPEPSRPPGDSPATQGEPREAPLPSPFRSFSQPDPEPGGQGDPGTGGGGEPPETGLGRVFRRLRRP
jgi:3-hydroxybutyryl-CoA dehydratase